MQYPVDNLDFETKLSSLHHLVIMDLVPYAQSVSTRSNKLECGYHIPLIETIWRDYISPWPTASMINMSYLLVDSLTNHVMLQFPER